MISKRMTKANRRDDLLDKAWELIATRGADSLTLATVAELAGVSKPVAYDHFETRTGILCALYERYYSEHISGLETALPTATTVTQAAETIARAYVECVLESGPVATALSAAMNGAAEMDALKQDCDERYMSLCAKTLTARSGRSPESVALVAFLGAAASVSEHVVSGRLSPDQAIPFLANMLTTSVA